MEIGPTEQPEHLFLEYSMYEVLYREGPHSQPWEFSEPWATMYIDAIREQRFGDAVWARYHMDGQVVDGIIKGPPNLTVMESIKEDAIGYKRHASEHFAKALLFYAKTSSADGHRDVIDVIFEADSEEPVDTEDEEEEEEEEEEDSDDQDGGNAFVCPGCSHGH
ncbi:hypothetical protein EDB81DRAFT_103244 [Dactylonectria macrodidyma]|uniref:Uncharacterized protein n=1 Tax=Dactylonectria macrodidyma TaxID=307937 RepID=A0A9P9E9R2_9HYPO|nr:hypothetical protein EDB81DRAFT_103244 [Dactylonectria macrodidyma]